jgi:hypothetical protein
MRATIETEHQRVIATIEIRKVIDYFLRDRIFEVLDNHQWMQLASFAKIPVRLT